MNITKKNSVTPLKKIKNQKNMFIHFILVVYFLNSIKKFKPKFDYINKRNLAKLTKSGQNFFKINLFYLTKLSFV